MRYRQIALVVLASFVIGPVATFPVQSELLATVGIRPPLWSVPGMVITSIMLWLLFAWLWTSRPADVWR